MPVVIFMPLGDAKSAKRVKRSKKVAEPEKGNTAAAFQQPKKDRENFRKALVDIIMQQDAEAVKTPPSPSQTGQELPPLSRTGSPTAAEKDILVGYATRLTAHYTQALYLIWLFMTVKTTHNLMQWICYIWYLIYLACV